MIEPYYELYAKSGLAVSNGIVQVEEGVPFRVLVAIFRNAPYTLPKGQVVGKLLPHPTCVFPSKVTLGEILGIAEEAPNNGGEAVNSNNDNSRSRMAGNSEWISEEEKETRTKEEALRITNVGKNCGGS